MASSGQDLANEVFFRINGRLSYTQIIPYINRGLNLLAASGSFQWDQYSVTTAPSSGIYTPSSSYYLDPGKKISAFNSPSNTPIQKVSQDDYPASAAGYVDQLAGGQEFNSFRVAYSGGHAILEFFPTSYTGTVVIYYHLLPPVLTYSTSPTVRWDTPWMDDLVIDYAEAEISRILQLANWESYEQRFKAKLMEAKRIYSTERITTGPPEEAQAAVVERDQIGRV